MAASSPIDTFHPSVEEGVRELMKLLPQVMGGLKRSGAPTPPGLVERFQQTSLGPRHIPALAYLAVDGPLSVTELRDRLGVTLTTASLMVTELNRQGLVDRREDDADRRRTIVSIAAEYREAVDGWLASRAEPVRCTLERLSPEARGHFVGAMRILDEELQRSGTHDSAC